MTADQDPQPTGPTAQDALRASEERFRLLVENTGDDFYLHDDQGRFLDVNQRACESTGYSREELLNLRVTDLSASHTNEETLAILAGTQPGTVSTVLAKHRSKDGRVYPVEVRVSCLLVDGRKVFLGMVRDISERIEAQHKVEQLNAELEQRVQQRTQQLRRSTEQLAQAERLARMGSWSLDLASGEFTSSEMLYEMNGADPAGPALTTADLQSMMTPESFERVSRAIAKCISDGEPYALDVTHLRPDGSSFAAHIRGQANRDAAGNVISLNGTVQDISEREEARVRLATLADNLPNGAIYRAEYDSDGNGHMSYMSAGIEPMVGLRPEQLMENVDLFLACIHPDDQQHYQHSGRHSLDHHSAFDCSFRVIRPDGSIAWLHCRSVATTVRPDGSSIWDGIIRDITQEHLAANALREAKEAAEAADRAKADFLAMMSHEIRTPMNSVIGMTRLMLQTELNPKQRNYLTKIDMSARALLAIINDILDFSKIEAGMLALEQIDFDLDAVLESVAAVTAVRAEEKALELIYRIAPAVPRRLRGDPLRLGQILTNLIGNALKFTQQGQVLLDIDLHDPTAEAGMTMLHFKVRDTGIGLEPAQIARLFKPFSQADTQTSRRHGGTGLGLAICHRLVQLMDGEIGVDSRAGAGSEFHFTARFGAAVAAAGEDDGPVDTAPLHGHRVLIVEDHADSRHVLLTLSDSLGMQATACDGAAAAIDLLRTTREPFDLALIDWRMPQMDGLTLMCQLIDEQLMTPSQLVLMVTAHAREEVLFDMERLGLRHLLFKPGTATMMATVLREACSPDEHTSPGTAANNDIGTLLLGRSILVVDDHDLNREVASDFLELAGARVVTASNGAQAILCLQEQAFDVVLMDVQMPVMDGLMATRVIRRREQWRDLPIIALTAQARTEDREHARTAGMNGHLTKPLDDQQLYTTLAQILEGREPAQTQPEPGAAAAAAPAHSSKHNQVDLADMQQRFNHRQDRIQRILHGFLQEFSSTPQRMEALWQAGDLNQLAATVHMLKGSVGYLGATELHQQAGLIEDAAGNGRQAEVDARMPALLASLRALLAELPVLVATVAQTQDLHRQG